VGWEPTPEDEAEEAAFQARYGPWDAMDPPGAAELLADYDHEWWVVGGWAIEAFTGVPRRHEDLDAMIWRRDLPAFRELLGDRFHLWGAGSGLLRPLDDEFPDLHPEAGQVWLRRDATSPWVLDCLVAEDRDGRWVSRRDPGHVAPLGEVTWVADDGVRYQRPEVVLHHKALRHRPKDLADLRETRPLLEPGRVDWLRDAVRRLDPHHPWLTELV
jgi:hypothetical protein